MQAGVVVVGGVVVVEEEEEQVVVEAAGGDLPSTPAAAESSPSEAWTTVQRRMVRWHLGGGGQLRHVARAVPADEGCFRSSTRMTTMTNLTMARTLPHEGDRTKEEEETRQRKGERGGGGALPAGVVHASVGQNS